MGDLRAAQDSLREVARLDAIGRAPRTEVWFPLLVFGLINAVAAPLVLMIGRDHLGSFYLPAALAGGVLSALHYRQTGRVSGLQAPLFAWLAVIAGATVAGAVCSDAGREEGWRALNLAGPGVALTVGYAILALWARSTVLLVAVAAMAVAIAFSVNVADGDPAIAFQVGSWAVVFFCLAHFNYSQHRRHP
ncbi:MAG TPA: hypothetical protein PKI89_06920 [Tepidiformaceae bacterium]|nr:hypothetical protein [Tepidiformaceae bacterium]